MADRIDVISLIDDHEIELSPIAEYAFYNYLSSDQAYELLKSYLEDELGIEVQNT